MKYILALLTILMATVAVYSAQPRRAAVFTPFTDRSDRKVYPSSGNYQAILSQPVLRFLKPLKQLKLVRSAPQTDKPLVINGWYRLSGPSATPRIVLNVTLRSGTEEIMNYRAETASDRMVFDTIDDLLGELYSAIKGLDEGKKPAPTRKPARPARTPAPKAPAVAQLELTNFNTGLENYNVVLNGEVVETWYSNTVTMRIPLAPGHDYQLELRLSDLGTAVLITNLNLRPAEKLKLSHQARASVRTLNLQNGALWETNSYRLGTNEILPSTNVSVINAGGREIFSVQNQTGQTVYHEEVFLRDGDNLTLKPSARWKGGFFPKINITGLLAPGIGLDYQITRQIWTGVNLGFWYPYEPLTGQSYFTFYPSLEAGFYLYGDRATDVRASAGIVAQYPFMLPAWGAYTNSSNFREVYPGAGGFVMAEVYSFFLRPAVYFDFVGFTARFQVMFGLKVDWLAEWR